MTPSSSARTSASMYGRPKSRSSTTCIAHPIAAMTIQRTSPGSRPRRLIVQASVGPRVDLKLANSLLDFSDELRHRRGIEDQGGAGGRVNLRQCARTTERQCCLIAGECLGHVTTRASPDLQRRELRQAIL